MANHLPAPGRPVPRSTHRLQLQPEFTFEQAAQVVDYLRDLGVTHVYCSPVLQSTPGSVHGYDVTDHTRLDDEMGGDAGFETLRAACRDAGLGIVVDVVPNHMAVPEPLSLNAPLWDVLARGRSSEFAEWFDIDWDAQGGRLLLPVLGSPVGECLERGEIRLDTSGGTPLIRYYDQVFPLAAGTQDTDDLAALLDAQHYRLAYWRVGTEELNYRRFFDVTGLIGVRVEDPAVFDATHRRILDLVDSGAVDGLRIDHPDGLADPRGYLERLASVTGRRWVVAEKILELHEQLPEDWECAGTTGYDALNRVLGVLTDPAGERPLTDLYTSLTGSAESYTDVVAAAKHHVVETILVAEVNRLTDVLVRLATTSPATRDMSRRWLREALVEVLAGFAVYRAYLAAPGEPVRDEARAHVAQACARARVCRPDRAAEIEWIGRLALGEGPASADAAEFATRFAQTTGPTMAKGVEDTAFYRYFRLTALNEVGGDPGVFGIPPDDFHAWCERVSRDWPATMTTLSTHDTKRSEDVRARLLALAELPAEWGEAVTAWRVGHQFGDPALEYLFWQSLVGAWPIPADRMAAYVEKASREAKQRTSWTDPDPDYDGALQDFVRGVFADADLLTDVGQWVEEHLLRPGRINALAQKALQLTMPGVPDVYQGCELWNLSLVDPDNRREVDYDARRRLLAELDSGRSPAALDEDDAGAAKLLLVSRVLRLRRDRQDLYGPLAAYTPVRAGGAAADHVVAFARGSFPGQGAVTVTTRLPVGLLRTGGWQDTTVNLPGARWTDVLTGREHAGGAVWVADVLADLPMAVLTLA